MNNTTRTLRPNVRLVVLIGVFLTAFLVPFENSRLQRSLLESFSLLSEYAREHVLLCLVPAFFIAGAILVFLNQQAVIRYLGPEARRPVAYGVASVSGAILAVCSCTVLPLFKGIYKKGAGIGPAVAFLYSGPAINILAVVLTAKVLGPELGVARALGAVLFAVLIGLTMAAIYRREDRERAVNAAMFSGGQSDPRPMWQTVAHLAALVAILVFLNWPQAGDSAGLWNLIYRGKYLLAIAAGVVLVIALIRWFSRDDLNSWVKASRDFAIQIVPLLFAGVMVAGFLFGRPDHDGLIPSEWVAQLVGGNSLAANLAASVAGALMYLATLTEVPILQGLLGAGMGQGPALALLLAGPSLSLPSILVISGELGWRKTGVYVMLVVVYSACAGMVYGAIF